MKDHTGLTARLRRLLEDCSYVRVHLDSQFLLHDQFLIPLIDFLGDPSGEDVLQNSGAYISNPLLWQLWDLTRLRQVVTHLIVRRHELGNGIDCEVLILWDRHVPDVLSLDLLLLATDNIFQEVDCDLLYKICNS